MKNFTDLTEQGLIALTEDEIKFYVDYACAENGVGFLPTLPPAPKEVTYTPDVQLYQVGYHYYFKTPEQASRVLEVLNECRPVEVEYINSPVGVTSNVVGSRSSVVTMMSVDAFSKERADALRQQLSGAKTEEDIYAKAKKEYDSAVKERQSYEEDIRGKIYDAREVHERRESRRRDYDRYLQLSENNKQIALRFLERAHSDVRELLPELFEPEVRAAEYVRDRGRDTNKG